jgi:uncharacterized protein YjbI with pentapeptide repeats
LENAYLLQAHLEGANLTEAHLERASLGFIHLEGANLKGAHLEGAGLEQAHLEGAELHEAHLEGADLMRAHLEGADLTKAHLESKAFTSGDPDLARIRQWVERFSDTLSPADLRMAFLSAATTLGDIHLEDAKGGSVLVVDLRWGGVNLAVVDWTPFTSGKAILGDEQAARDFRLQPFSETEDTRKKSRRARAQARAADAAEQERVRLGLFKDAVRANRQLATLLRDQGLSADADHFAYRLKCLTGMCCACKADLSNS